MKKMIPAYLICSIIAVQSTSLFCQKLIEPEYKPVISRFDNFLLKDGYANQTTTYIMFDRKGFLWSGTLNGLYRFDGEKYLEYQRCDTCQTGYAGDPVVTIFEDRAGYIWVGTDMALNRLDPASGVFTHFYPDTSESSAGNNVINLVREDNEGVLWIVTNRNIFSLNPNTRSFTEYPVDTSAWRLQTLEGWEEPSRFLIDNNGNKWFGTTGGLYLYNNSQKRFEKVFPACRNCSEEQHSDITCLGENSDGTIWFGTSSGRVYRLNKGEKMPVQVNYNLSENGHFYTVSAIFPEREDRIWIFGDLTFCIFNPLTGTSEQYKISYRQRTLYESPISSAFINKVFKHKDGAIWFFNYFPGLLFRFDPSADRLSMYRSPNFVVNCCLMDDEGAFWFACVRNNIWRMTTSGYPFSEATVNNTAEVITAGRQKIISDANGKIWMMLYRGMYRMDPLEKHAESIPEIFRFGRGDTIYRSIFCDRNGLLWFGGRNREITTLDQSTGKTRTYFLDSRIPVSGWEDVTKITEDSSGNIWALACFKGLYRFDRTKGLFEKKVSVEDLDSTDQRIQIADYLIDRKGQHWLVAFKGIYRVDMETEEIYEYSPHSVTKRLYDGINLRIRSDKNGDLWVLNSKKGLYKYNSEADSFSKIDLGSEFDNTQFYDLLSDNKSRLWIAHAGGISITDPSTGIRRSIRTPLLQYDVQGYLTSSGHVLYLNDQKLYIFEPEISSNKQIPPVYITGITIGGLSYGRLFSDSIDIREVKDLRIKYNQGSLVIEYAALNWLDPQNNQYRYFMKGIDRDTVFAGTSNFTEYKKLNPGKYTFWVTGSNNDGIWNKDGVTLNIRIVPPWHRSTLAFIFYGLCLIMFIALYIRFRIQRLKSEKIYLQDQIGIHTRELEVKNRQLQENDRLKTRFFTDISHEIRTPLSLILGPLDTISSENHFDDRTESLIELMKRNGQRLMQLVTQMLDISRLETGRMKLKLSESDITLFLKIILYDFVSMAESRKIRYLVDIQGSQFITLFDRDKTEKIISNLLSNAFKFTRQGGTVSCRAEIREKIGNGFSKELAISVADTGEGITSENIERIFDRFFRVENENNVSTEGTGIGLSLTRELVELLHGRLEVDSKPGEGSLFRVTIPLGKGHLAEDEYTVIESTEQDSPPKEAEKWKESEKIYIHNNGHHKSRILVIEDNNELRNFICDNLSSGFEVTGAENGEVGLNLGLTMLPDLIITDIMLPDLDGITICSKLKSDFHTSHIPVVILTARATSEDKIEGLKTGADDYIIKPFSMPELKVRISNLLEQREKLKARFRSYTGNVNKTAEEESVDEIFMRKVVTIINENIKDFNFDVRSLQAHLGMSRMHLFRKMKALTGLPPVIFIRNMRLARAAELIRNKTGNVTEVAYSVGMSNPSYFAKCFREHFGVAPKDYAAKKDE